MSEADALPTKRREPSDCGVFRRGVLRSILIIPPPDCDKRVSKWCLFVGACARCCFGIASRGDPSPPGGDLPPLKPRHFVWWGFLVSGRRGCYPCSVGLADLTGTHTPHQCTARAYPPSERGRFLFRSRATPSGQCSRQGSGSAKTRMECLRSLAGHAVSQRGI